LARSKLVLVEPNQRCIGTNMVPTARRGDSHWVEKTSDSENGAGGETMSGFDLIIIEQVDLVGGIESGIPGLNLTEDTNKLPGVLSILDLLTGRFAELLYGVVPENRQLDLVGVCSLQIIQGSWRVCPGSAAVVSMNMIRTGFSS